jgi:hypothetical protein
LHHPLNRNRRTATLARWAVHNARRRLTPGRELTVTFLESPLRGPIDHPIINLLTYVRGGLYDYDAMTALTMLLEPGQMFIDVGANIGPYSVLAGNLVGASGQVVAIEPSADQLPYLRRNLRDLAVESRIRRLRWRTEPEPRDYAPRARPSSTSSSRLRRMPQ